MATCMAYRMSHCQQSAGLPTHSGYLYACVDNYNYTPDACIANNGCTLVDDTYARKYRDMSALVILS